jgi:PIN domain nuclease of toxin-antitoxin system
MPLRLLLDTHILVWAVSTPHDVPTLGLVDMV